jgi:hypothetical protein
VYSRQWNTGSRPVVRQGRESKVLLPPAKSELSQTVQTGHKSQQWCRYDVEVVSGPRGTRGSSMRPSSSARRSLYPPKSTALLSFKSKGGRVCRPSVLSVHVRELRTTGSRKAVVCCLLSIARPYMPCLQWYYHCGWLMGSGICSWHCFRNQPSCQGLPRLYPFIPHLALPSFTFLYLLSPPFIFSPSFTFRQQRIHDAVFLTVPTGLALDWSCQSYQSCTISFTFR